MRLSGPLIALNALVAVVASPLPDGKITTAGVPPPLLYIDNAHYQDLAYYFKYATSAYKDTCARPSGNTLIYTINAKLTDTRGFIARDDARKEIVVSFRGTSSATNVFIDSLIVKHPLGQLVNAPNGVDVHTGFLAAWAAAYDDVVKYILQELVKYPSYTIVTSGHSLGGALASLAGVSLRVAFPNQKVRIYTYGQPRTGNPAYAAYINRIVGVENIFRSVHTIDPVPRIVLDGYLHHSTEFFTPTDTIPANFPNPVTIQCTLGGEDPRCSASTDAQINAQSFAAHSLYYGIYTNQTFC